MSRWLTVEMKNIQNHVGARIHQHDMAANDGVGAMGRRWRQALFQIGRARAHVATHVIIQHIMDAQAPLVSGRQTVFLG